MTTYSLRPVVPAATIATKAETLVRHKYHGIPIYRNIKPIRECTLHHCVGPGATVQNAIAVPILTPIYGPPSRPRQRTCSR